MKRALESLIIVIAILCSFLREYTCVGNQIGTYNIDFFFLQNKSRGIPLTNYNTFGHAMSQVLTTYQFEFSNIKFAIVECE